MYNIFFVNIFFVYFYRLVRSFLFQVNMKLIYLSYHFVGLYAPFLFNTVGENDIGDPKCPQII